ncbi:MAG TPA: hypothetical protein PLO56_02145 [Rhodothermales bacterium]|nr:hypothetical protein [Rhodothermales bacterium]
MKYTLTKLFASLVIIVFSGSITAFAQFTVTPTAITTTGTSGSTATGTQSVSVN